MAQTTNLHSKQPLGGAAPTLAANDLSSARPEDLGALFVSVLLKMGTPYVVRAH